MANADANVMESVPHSLVAAVRHENADCLKRDIHSDLASPGATGTESFRMEGCDAVCWR